MTFSPRPLALLLVAAFITVDYAYAKRISVEAPLTQMTAYQARKAMAESFNHLSFHKSVREVKFNRQKVTFVADDVLNHRMQLQCSVSFAELNNLSVEKYTKKYMIVYSNNTDIFYFDSGPHARMFVDALLILKAAAKSPDPDSADFATFSTGARHWRETEPKPKMPDEARTYMLLAEDAFKRKDFAAALDAYCEALEKHPMWPEGHYNAALLAAEVEDYEMAAQHMRRYLVLAPDAKDASAAKDKLLLWQHKAKE